VADIIAEINTIGDLLVSVGADRLYKQDLPKTYVANTLGIRWQGEVSKSETAYHYRIDRRYQIIYFASSEVKCLQIAPKLTQPIEQNIKTKLRGSDAYMTLGSLSLSAPFKTETDGVYAIIGILPVSIREARQFEQVPKMRVIDAEITPRNSEGIALSDGVYSANSDEKGAI